MGMVPGARMPGTFEPKNMIIGISTQISEEAAGKHHCGHARPMM